MKVVNFLEIKDLLPKNSIAIRQYEHDKKDTERKKILDNEKIIFIEGDIEVENICLDYDSKFGDLSDGTQAYLILVYGNLKAKNIYSFENDGSVSLIVYKNLIVDNMIVGGQEIYVGEDLTVKNLFWGDYNHGSLMVDGQTSALVFMATEEYHYDYEKKKITAEYFLCDEDEGVDFNISTIQNLFKPELVYDEDDLDADEWGWNVYIDREKCIEYLKEDKEVLKTEFKYISQEAIDEKLYEQIPKVFSSSAFFNQASFQEEINNFEKLITLIDIDDKFAEQYFRYEELKCTIYIAKKHHRSGDNRRVDKAITVIFDKEGELYIWRKEINPLKRLVKKEAPLIAVYADENRKIKPFDVFKDEEATKKLHQVWNYILKTANFGLYYLNLFKDMIKPEDILEVLDYPVIQQKYNDYWDNDDKNGFWSGNFFVAFRLSGARGYSGSIDIGKEIIGDEFDLRKYMFRADSVDNPQKTFLVYLSSQEENADDRYNDVEVVWLWDWKLYQEALKWYPKIKKIVKDENLAFLLEQEENKPIEEKTNQEIFEALDEDINNGDALFTNRMYRLTHHEYFKTAEKQSLYLDFLNVTINILWNEDRSKGFAFDQPNNQKVRFFIIVPCNLQESISENTQLYIYEFSKTEHQANYYFIPNITTVKPSDDLSSYVLLSDSKKQILLNAYNYLYDFTEYLDEQIDKFQLLQKRQKQMQIPFETMIFDGYEYKVINLQEAHELIGNLTDFQGNKLYDVFEDTWRFPDYEENAFFLLAEEDMVLEKLELDYSTDEHPDITILGFIFKKSLAVKSYIEAYDTDNSPVLVVLEKVQAQNIALFGNVFYFGNGVNCETIMGFYNHGELFIKGSSSVVLVYASDMRIHFETFDSIISVISIENPNILLLTSIQDENDNVTKKESYLANTHFLEDIILAKYIKDGELYYEDKNRSIINYRKEAQFRYLDYKDDVFRLFDEFSKILDTKKKKRIKSKDKRTNVYFTADVCFEKFDSDKKKYLQFVYTLRNTYNIQMRTTVNEKNYNKNGLALEYLDENDEVQYEWEGKIGDSNLQMKMVIHALYLTARILKKDY